MKAERKSCLHSNSRDIVICCWFNTDRFAYQVHTDIGHRCRGAKLTANLSHWIMFSRRVIKLKSWQLKRRPKQDWLNRSLGLVRTSRARSKIRQWFKQDRELNLAKINLEKEFQATWFNAKLILFTGR